MTTTLLPEAPSSGAAPRHDPYAWVPAAPFGAHFRSVMAETRLPWRVLAFIGEIPAPLARSLAHGRTRRLPLAIARRVLALDSRVLIPLREQRVAPGTPARHVAALLAAGFGTQEVATFAGCSALEVRRIHREAEAPTALVALRLAAAAEAHGLAYREPNRAAA